MKQPQASMGRMVGAGLLTWLLPGAGHWVQGHRGLAVVFFLGISIPYWVGLAVGGVKNSVNPYSNHWLFLAEMGAGGYTTVCFLANFRIGELDPRVLKDPKYLSTLPEEQRARFRRYISYFPESDVAQIYLATAGLLNVLAILDAIARAQTGGLPTFHRELLAREAARQAGEGQA